MIDSDFKHFQVMCNKHLKVKSFIPDQIVVQVESDFRSNWNFYAIILGIIGFCLLVIGIADLYSDDLERDGEFLFLIFAFQLFLFARISMLMAYRKPGTWSFDKKNNQIFVAINRASKQISIQDNDSEINATLSDARFAMEIGNVGGVFFAALKVNLDTGRALIVESSAKVHLKETEKLYKYFMEFTQNEL